MTYIRRLILALALSAGLSPAFAQVAPPVPALPDTERRTSYSISASTCACSVGFALYGDSTDYANWIEVFVNGVRMAQAGNWTLSSVTGTIGSIPLPITNAVLTFTAPQTGTIQIVGARRPRRTSQFNEGAGVPTRNFNVVLSDLTAQNRELWDKTNDVTGRALISQPGNTISMLPLPSACGGKFLGFDATGLIPQCISSSPGLGTVVGPGTTVAGHLATWANTVGTVLADTGPAIGTSGANVPLLSTANTWSGVNKFSANVLFGGPAPFVDVESGSNSCAAAAGNGSTDDQAAIQCQINFLNTNFGGGIVYFHPGHQYSIASGLTVKGGVILQGSGRSVTTISTTGDFTALAFDSSTSFAEIKDIFILGSQSATATLPVVTVAANKSINFTNCFIWGGSAGLSTAGTDGMMLNCDVKSANTTTGVGILSSGANWYVRSKLDNGSAAAAAFKQTTSAVGVAENHFVDCDFSGTYTNSVVIDDTTNTTAATIFSNSVFSSPILITKAKSTIINGAEIGGAITANSTGPVILTGNWGLSPTTVTGTAPLTCSGNVNIDCTSNLTNSLVGAVTMTTQNTVYDGPSVAQGSVGTWFASGNATVAAVAANNQILCKLWDGTTVIDSGQLQPSNSLNVTMHLSGKLATPAGNLRISCTNVSASGGTIAVTNGVDQKASTISAFRIQ